MPGKGGYELEIPIDTSAVDRAFEKMQQKIDALNRVDTDKLTKSSEDAMKRLERVAEAVEKKVDSVNTGDDMGIGGIGSRDEHLIKEFDRSQSKLGRGIGNIQAKANKVQEKVQGAMHSGFGDVVSKLFPPLAIVAGGVGTILAALETGFLGNIFEILSKTAEMYLMPISMVMGMFLKPFALHGMRMAMSWMKYAQPWFKKALEAGEEVYQILQSDEASHLLSSINDVLNVPVNFLRQILDSGVPVAYADDGIPVDYGDTPDIEVIYGTPPVLDSYGKPPTLDRYGAPPVIEFVKIGGVEYSLDELSNAIRDGIGDNVVYPWLEKLSEIDPSIGVDDIQAAIDTLYDDVASDLREAKIAEIEDYIEQLEDLGVKVSMPPIEGLDLTDLDTSIIRLRKMVDNASMGFENLLPKVDAFGRSLSITSHTGTDDPSYGGDASPIPGAEFTYIVTHENRPGETSKIAVPGSEGMTDAEAGQAGAKIYNDLIQTLLDLDRKYSELTGSEFAYAEHEIRDNLLVPEIESIIQSLTNRINALQPISDDIDVGNQDDENVEEVTEELKKIKDTVLAAKQVLDVWASSSQNLYDHDDDETTPMIQRDFDDLMTIFPPQMKDILAELGYDVKNASDGILSMIYNKILEALDSGKPITVGDGSGDTIVHGYGSSSSNAKRVLQPWELFEQSGGIIDWLDFGGNTLVRGDDKLAIKRDIKSQTSDEQIGHGSPNPINLGSVENVGKQMFNSINQLADITDGIEGMDVFGGLRQMGNLRQQGIETTEEYELYLERFRDNLSENKIAFLEALIETGLDAEHFEGKVSAGRFTKEGSIWGGDADIGDAAISTIQEILSWRDMLQKQQPDYLFNAEQPTDRYGMDVQYESIIPAIIVQSLEEQLKNLFPEKTSDDGDFFNPTIDIDGDGWTDINRSFETTVHDMGDHFVLTMQAVEQEISKGRKTGNVTAIGDPLSTIVTKDSEEGQRLLDGLNDQMTSYVTLSSQMHTDLSDANTHLGNIETKMDDVVSAVKSNPTNVTIAVTQVLGDYQGGPTQ